jgi:hypothetical protein
MSEPCEGFLISQRAISADAADGGKYHGKMLGEVYRHAWEVSVVERGDMHQ